MLPPPARRTRSLPNKPRVFVTFVRLAIAGLDIWREWTSYNAELSDAEYQSLDLAKSFAQHADDGFEVANTALLAIVELGKRERLGSESVKRLHDLMALDVVEQPRPPGMFVYDERGFWPAGSLSEMPRGVN
jgi:hypothetical protein